MKIKRILAILACAIVLLSNSYVLDYVDASVSPKLKLIVETFEDSGFSQSKTAFVAGEDIWVQVRLEGTGNIAPLGLEALGFRVYYSAQLGNSANRNKGSIARNGLMFGSNHVSSTISGIHGQHGPSFNLYNTYPGGTPTPLIGEGIISTFRIIGSSQTQSGTYVISFSSVAGQTAVVTYNGVGASTTNLVPVADYVEFVNATVTVLGASTTPINETPIPNEPHPEPSESPVAPREPSKPEVNLGRAQIAGKLDRVIGSREYYSFANEAIAEIAKARSNGAQGIDLKLGAEVDRAMDVDVTIAPILLNALAEGDGLELRVTTPQGAISLPPILIKMLALQGNALNLIVQRGNADQLAPHLPPGAQPQGDPLQVITTITGTTTVQIPLEIALPLETTARTLYLNSLCVFALHSDGEQGNLSDLVFEIEELPTPVLKGVSFSVDKFSTFALVKYASEPLTTMVNQRGFTIAGVKRDMVSCYYKGKDTMMPIRMLEEYGVVLDWHEETQTATLVYKNNSIKLTIGSTNAYINGAKAPIIGASGLPVAPDLAPGRTMIPLRFVSEKLGFGVHWDPPNLITITPQSW